MTWTNGDMQIVSSIKLAFKTKQTVKRIKYLQANPFSRQVSFTLFHMALEKETSIEKNKTTKPK